METTTTNESGKMETVYDIPLDVFKKFTKRMDTLVARSKKLSGTSDIRVELLDFNDVRYFDSDENKWYMVPCRQVKVHGSAPKVTEEWEFLGTVDRKTVEGEVLFKMVPGQARSEHAKEMGEKGVCEHCGVVRNRNATFILKSVETGEEKLVGRQCVRDFLGHVTPAHVAEMASLLDQLFKQTVDVRSSSRRTVSFPVDHFLALVVHGIAKVGYYDKHHTPATADDVMHFVYGNGATLVRSKDALENIKELARITEETHPYLWEKAHNVLDWAKQQVDSNGGTYWENFNKVVAVGHMTSSTIRLVASAVVGYDREMGNIKDREAARASEYVGKVGDKVEFTLTLKNVQHFDFAVNAWTIQTVSFLRFVDSEGNVVVWKASKFVSEEEAGKTFVVRGTVKSHEEYKGTKQTYLTRCKMTEVEA